MHTLENPPVSNAVGCAKSHLLCTDTDRKARIFTVMHATKSICLTSRIAFIRSNTTKFEPAHEFHLDCGFCPAIKKCLLVEKKCQSSIPHTLPGSTGVTAADTWLESSSLCRHHVSLSTHFSELLHCPAQQPRSEDRTTAVQADNSVLCSPA